MARFGDDSAGASSFPLSGDRAILSQFTLAEAANVTEIVVLFEATTTAGSSFKGLIYADAGGVPGARVAVGAATAIPAGASATASPCVVTLAAGTYWLGLVTDSFEARAQCDASGGLSRMEGTTYASPAATWTQSGTGSARVNVYAEYTAAVSDPLLFLRKFPMQGPRAGDTSWADESPARVLAQYEFWGPQEAGPPTYSRGARATARPDLAASRLTTAIRSALVRQRAEVSASRALTASRAAAAKARPEVSASRAVTAARGAIARARAEVSAARTAVLARVARATAVTRAAATAVVVTVSTYSRAARASARTAASAARAAVLSRAARASARAEVNAGRTAVLSRAARATAATRASATALVQTVGNYSRAARAAARTAARAARTAVLARAASAPARARAAAARLLALARPAAARARGQVRADRAVVIQRAARATTRARIRAAVDKVTETPLRRWGELRARQAPRLARRGSAALRPGGAAVLALHDAARLIARPVPQMVAR